MKAFEWKQSIYAFKYFKLYLRVYCISDIHMSIRKLAMLTSFNFVICVVHCTKDYLLCMFLNLCGLGQLSPKHLSAYYVRPVLLYLQATCYRDSTTSLILALVSQAYLSYWGHTSELQYIPLFKVIGTDVLRAQMCIFLICCKRQTYA